MEQNTDDMNIHFFTLALDAMPWITHHLPVFNSLPKKIHWDWTIIHGVAAPILDTSWCIGTQARLSNDGTTEYLESISTYHPRVKVVSKPLWNGKVEMCNEALSHMKTPGLLWQIDADELWKSNQIEWINKYMEESCVSFLRFACRYFVGHNIVVSQIPGTWTNDVNMWDRVWRFVPGMLFKTHEPPVLVDQKPSHYNLSSDSDLHFQHYAYATEQQVKFKESYYGYNGALYGWRQLQKNTVWPAKLKNFFPWVKDETTARKLYE